MRTLTLVGGVLRRVSEAPLAELLCIGVAILVLTGCKETEASARNEFGGDARHGATLIRNLGCGSCHDIPGIEGANGLVGPPLDRIGRRVYLAGMLRNTPDNMVAWLRNPQAVVPGNVMPNMGLSDDDARDVAAYLDTLR